MSNEIKADTFDRINGVAYLWHSENPDVRYEVVQVLDCEGNDTDDDENAFGGVIKRPDGRFQPFFFGAPLIICH